MRLDLLTAGDFANVKRRFDLPGASASLEDWLRELALEHADRQPLARPAIGFA